MYVQQSPGGTSSVKSDTTTSTSSSCTVSNVTTPSPVHYKKKKEAECDSGESLQGMFARLERQHKVALAFQARKRYEAMRCRF